MSTLASFIRLHRDDLKELVSAVTGDDPQELVSFLLANGASVVEFDGGGEIFPVLLPVLAEDYDIDLETSENGLISDLAEVSEALVFILTPEEKIKYLESLSPEQFSAEELADAYEDFTEETEGGAGGAMLAGIVALHQALQEVDDDHVVVIAVE